MKLYVLLYGKSKKRMKPIMVDELHKYEKSRAHTVAGWHKIVPADEGAATWRKRTTTVGGNRCEISGLVGRGRPGRHLLRLHLRQAQRPQVQLPSKRQERAGVADGLIPWASGGTRGSLRLVKSSLKALK